MLIRKILTSMALCLFLLSLCGMPALAVQKFDVACGDPEDSEHGVAAKAFKKYVEEKTNGNVKINLFFSCALGDETEALRNVQKGSLAFAIVGIANLVPFEKRLGVLNLPYLFDNLDEVVAGTNGEAAKLLNSYAMDAGFRVLCWVYSDFRFISNSKHPIKRMADMKGLKFRTPQSPVLIESYKAFGGSPTPISWAETFTALQQGVVDGQCLGLMTFQTAKFNEAHQKYISEVHYTYHVQPFVMSEKIYRATSPELQKIFLEGGLYAQEQVLKYEKEGVEKAKKDLMAAGVIFNQLEDETEWKMVALEKVWPVMAKDVGGEKAINAYLKTIGKKPWHSK